MTTIGIFASLQDKAVDVSGTMDIYADAGFAGLRRVKATAAGGTVEGDPATADHRVLFVDFEGSLLKTHYVMNGADGNPPPNPLYERIEFQEYNNPYTNVTADIICGANYRTKNGKTQILFRGTTVTGLQPTLNLNKSDTALMTITWGDSTSQTTSASGAVAITKTAAYSGGGDYWIEIECAGLHRNNGYLFGNTDYQKAMIAFYCGDNWVDFNSDCLRDATGLREVSAHKDCDFNALSLTRLTRALKCIVVPYGQTTITTWWNLGSSARVILPITINATGSLTLNLNSGADFAYLPLMVNLGNEVFRRAYYYKTIEFGSVIESFGSLSLEGCQGLYELVIMATTPPTLPATTVLSDINPACKIFVPDASVAAYKAATNWSVYADYIYPISQRVKLWKYAA